MFSHGSVVVQGKELSIAITVKSDLKYGHQMDRTKCPLYRGVRIIEVGNVFFFYISGTKRTVLNREMSVL